MVWYKVYSSFPFDRRLIPRIVSPSTCYATPYRVSIKYRISLQRRRCLGLSRNLPKSFRRSLSLGAVRKNGETKLNRFGHASPLFFGRHFRVASQITECLEECLRRRPYRHPLNINLSNIFLFWLNIFHVILMNLNFYFSRVWRVWRKVGDNFQYLQTQ